MCKQSHVQYRFLTLFGIHVDTLHFLFIVFHIFRNHQTLKEEVIRTTLLQSFIKHLQLSKPLKSILAADI